MKKHPIISACGGRWVLFCAVSLQMGGCALEDAADSGTSRGSAGIEASAEETEPAECRDDDGDGFSTCVSAAGAPDCDDASTRTQPGASEWCDGADNDCDGDIDEYITGCDTAWPPGPPAGGPRDDWAPGDEPPSAPARPWPAGCVDDDEDDFPVCPDANAMANQDCDDTTMRTQPGASEWCDGADNDCDGEVDEGFSGCDAGEDDDPASGSNGWPSGCVDDDEDGFPICPDPDAMANQDCDDTTMRTQPGASEWCDGTDNDCDGDIDEDFQAPCPRVDAP